MKAGRQVLKTDGRVCRGTGVEGKQTGIEDRRTGSEDRRIVTGKNAGMQTIESKRAARAGRQAGSAMTGMKQVVATGNS